MRSKWLSVPLKTKSAHSQKGFTLIELLVAMSIIAMLASMIFASLKGARDKAFTVVRTSQLRQTAEALQLFYDQKGRMPLNYNGEGPVAPTNDPSAFHPAGISNLSGETSWGACDAVMPGLDGGGVDVPGCDPCKYHTLDRREAYDASMQELVDAGVLKSIPHTPTPGGPGYCYYDFGTTSPGHPGAILWTQDPTAEPSLTGPAGTWRVLSGEGSDICGSSKPLTSICFNVQY